MRALDASNSLRLRDLNLGGFMISYSPTDHTGSDFTDLTIVGRHGKFVH